MISGWAVAFCMNWKIDDITVCAVWGRQFFLVGTATSQCRNPCLQRSEGRSKTDVLRFTSIAKLIFVFDLNVTVKIKLNKSQLNKI